MSYEMLHDCSRQHHGLVLTRQLRGLGLTRARLARLRAQGWISNVRPGVVLVGGGPVTPWHRVVAATLVAGPDAALSHMTAARVHRLACAVPPGPTDMVDLILGPGRRAQLGGCRVHRSRALAEGEVEVYRGVRVTAPVRTLVDLAPGLPVALLGRTVDEGLIQRIWTVEDLAVGAARSAGRPGSASLREIVRRRTGEGPAESHLEQRVIRTLKAFAPFETDYEVVVDGRVYRLDVAFPASLVAVECDGWAVRSRSRSKFDHDRRRNNSLLSHGWIVVHLTSAMSDDEMRGAVHAALLQAARNRAG